jgi:hypothetical protein
MVLPLNNGIVVVGLAHPRPLLKWKSGVITGIVALAKTACSNP